MTHAKAQREHSSALLLSVFAALREIFKRLVPNPVRPPVLEIEMPPLGFVDSEPLILHRPAQKLSVPALAGRTAPVVRVSPIGKLIEAADHLDRLSGLSVVER